MPCPAYLVWNSTLASRRRSFVCRHRFVFGRGSVRRGWGEGAAAATDTNTVRYCSATEGRWVESTEGAGPRRILGICISLSKSHYRSRSVGALGLGEPQYSPI